MKIGPTGIFPRGKLNDTDEGELAVGIAADKSTKKVLIQFGTPTAWIGMDPDQAIGFAQLIQDKALELKEL
jgi:hypothetical protein